MANATQPPFDLRCEMRAHAHDSRHIVVEFALRNRGPSVVQILSWGSPFEGAWWAPFVRVNVGQGELPYLGAQMKRGKPEPSDYLGLKPGQAITARLNLEDAYDWSALTGQALLIRSRWRWHDVIAGPGSPLNTPRSAQHALEQDCGAVSLNPWTAPQT